MDLIGYAVTSAIITLVGLIILYFVIKNAVKNALIEDRAFQAKIEKLRREGKQLVGGIEVPLDKP